MTRPCIIIAGDSYSDWSRQSCTQGGLEDDSTSWVALLSDHYNIECLAYQGCANWDILRQVRPWLSSDQLKLVNFSALARWSPLIQPIKQLTKDEIIEQQRKMAYWLAEQPNTLCWTPFPGYDHPKIHCLPFERENELYSERAQQRCTHHHFTRRGNELMYEWALDQIKRHG